MLASFLRLCALVLLLLGVTSSAYAASPGCDAGSLLGSARLHKSQHVQHAERITDEWFTLDGMPFDHPDAARFVSATGEVSWDLGAPRNVGVIELQADGNDTYVVEGAISDGEWSLLGRVPPSSGSGLATRTLAVSSSNVRYLRLRGEGGDGIYSVAELRLFCSEEERAKLPRRVHNNLETPSAVRSMISAYSAKLVMLGVVPVLAFFVFPRLRERGRRWLLAVGLVLSALAWIQFGSFNGVSAVHGTDSFHYFMGSKYFRSVGYFGLYPCVYKAERELGHGNEYQGGLVRDIADNRIWHSSWLDTPAGACRGDFSPAKWSEFRADVAAFREVMRGQVTLSRALVDHGYNATPYHTAFLRAFTLHVKASYGSLLALAQLDSLALLLATAAIYWGFGGLGALLFAIVVATGAHWGYGWVGGSLGRHIWLAWAAFGLSASRRQRPMLAALAFTFAGLHRIFPFVLLLGHFVYLAFGTRRRGGLAVLRAAFAGSALALTLATGVALSSVGTDAFRSFVHVFERHAATPGGNRLGLPILFAVGPDRFGSSLEDSRLTDPTEVWRTQVKAAKAAHYPLRLAAAVVALGLLLWVAFRRGRSWEVVLAALPLVYVLQDVTSYDYTWLALLVPALLARTWLRTWLLGYVGLTIVLTLYLANLELQHFLCNWALFVLFLRFGMDLARHPSRLPHARRSMALPHVAYGPILPGHDRSFPIP